MPFKSPDLPPAGRLQCVVGGALLLAIAFTAVALDGVAHNQALAAWLAAREEAFCRRTGSEFFDAGYFIDPEDRLLNEELPGEDYSKGGVYLFGTSNARVATKFWELPPAQRALIHNYAISKSSHRHHLQFIRYLVEQKGLLSAGGDKTLVVFAVSYHDARYDPDGYFAQLWGRHGIYRYSESGGIQGAAINPIRHFADSERGRIAGLLGKLNAYLTQEIHVFMYRHGEAQKKINPGYYNQRRRESMGPGWEPEMHSQLDDLKRTLDYLHDHRAHAAVVLMPQGSWEKNLPFERTYNSEMSKICRERGVDLHDWSTVLDDQDFEDSVHPNGEGMEKLNDAFLNIARPFLRFTKALPGG
jgi:hypothetical protein